MSLRPSAGATILLIEADEVAARNLQDMLIGFGHSVQLAASAQDAMDLFEPENVDLILLDLNLRDADGLMLCSSLRSRGSTPIVVLSSRPREVDRLLSLAMGASDFLSKPIKLDALPRIEAAIGGRRDLELVAASR
jgi:two-component system response regulator RegX3